MSKVKTDRVRTYKRTCLLDMGSESVAESLLDEVGCGVCATDSIAAALANRRFNLIALCDCTLNYFAYVEELSVLCLLYILLYSIS